MKTFDEVLYGKLFIQKVMVLIVKSSKKSYRKL